MEVQWDPLPHRWLLFPELSGLTRGGAECFLIVTKNRTLAHVNTGGLESFTCEALAGKGNVC